MKFFLDTGNLEEIKRIVKLGLVDGVTTNPSIIAKEKRPFKDIIQEITTIVPGPVSAEVISLEASEMVKEATSWLNGLLTLLLSCLLLKLVWKLLTFFLAKASKQTLRSYSPLLKV